MAHSVPSHPLPLEIFLVLCSPQRWKVWQEFVHTNIWLVNCKIERKKKKIRRARWTFVAVSFGGGKGNYCVLKHFPYGLPQVQGLSLFSPKTAVSAGSKLSISVDILTGQQPVSTSEVQKTVDWLEALASGLWLFRLSRNNGEKAKHRTHFGANPKIAKKKSSLSSISSIADQLGSTTQHRQLAPNPDHCRDHSYRRSEIYHQS